MLIKVESKVEPTKGGDNSQYWDALLTKYAPLISARIRNWNCLSLGAEADDVLQEVRIKLWKVTEHGGSKRFSPAYLRKVTDSVIISNFRKIRNTIEFKEKRVSPVHFVLKTFDRNSDLPIMARLIYAKLPLIRESRRRVLSLYLFGFTYKEIAEYFEFTIAKTRSLYYRGVCDVKKHIQGIEP